MNDDNIDPLKRLRGNDLRSFNYFTVFTDNEDAAIYHRNIPLFNMDRFHPEHDYFPNNLTGLQKEMLRLFASVKQRLLMKSDLSTTTMPWYCKSAGMMVCFSDDVTVVVTSSR